MTEIKLSPELERAIGKIDGEKKIVDERGEVRGYIITPMMHQAVSTFLGLDLNWEELSKDEDEKDLMSTEEVFASLEKRFPGFRTMP